VERNAADGEHGERYLQRHVQRRPQDRRHRDRTLSGSTVAWNALATATVPGLPACAISLTGTAELGVDSIRVPYSGDTCLGKVSGVEVLKKN